MLCKYVLLKISTSTKTFFTVTATPRLLFCVGAHNVRPQVRILFKSLLAESTRKRFFLGVEPHVGREVTHLRISLTTKIAVVLSFWGGWAVTELDVLPKI